MAYHVGSLADFISGTQDADSRKVLYVPFKRKVNQNIPTTNEISTPSRNKKENILHKTNPTKNVGTGKKRKYSDVSEGNVVRKEHEQNENAWTSPVDGKKTVKLDAESESRTIFIKNLPNTMDVKAIKKNFKVYGNIECVRIRCAPVKDIRIKKKIAVIKKSFHPERTNICAFVRFKDLNSAEKALAANGTLVEDHHIFVDKSTKEEKHNQKKAVFLGNVPFGAEEDDIWNIFAKCGEIVDIRVVRDKTTGLGKGIAFVNFKSADAVEIALSLHGVKLKEKELRISRVVKKPVFRETNRGNMRKSVSERGRRRGIQENSEKSEDTIYGNTFSNKRPSYKNSESKFHSKQQIGGKKKKKKFSAASENRERNSHGQQFQGQRVMEQKVKKKKMNKNERKKNIIAKKLTNVSKYKPTG